jgi:predicted MFS family arabinose efflux permease
VGQRRNSRAEAPPLNSPATPGGPRHLTTGQEYLLALAAAVVTANAYYIHPIVGDVARTFGVSLAGIGVVPALNQLALAIGILLLLPLGDRFSNRGLTIAFCAGQCAGLLLMTLSSGFAGFVMGSTLLGFFTLAPYLLPAYASKRVAPERLGHVTAILTSGVIFGILVARVGSGVVAHYFGWRTVYWIASAAMIAITLALPRIMTREGSEGRAGHGSYLALLASIGPVVAQNREILISGVIQGLGFGQFIALWLGLALHLTSPDMGYGTDTVGYLAGFAAVSVLTTPYWGRLADRVGPRRARVWFALGQTAGTALLLPFGDNLWLLMIPLIAGNIVGPAIDVTTRMTFLSLDPALRTRLTTVYIAMMFAGGAIGSVAGTAAFEAFGWTGTAAYALASCAAITVLAVVARRLYDATDLSRS